MTRDEAWAALRAAFPGRTRDICIDLCDWDMTHTKPFVGFHVSVMPDPTNGGTCWQSKQYRTLAPAVEEAVTMARGLGLAPVVDEAATYMQAAHAVPELSREQTGRLTAALAETPDPAEAMLGGIIVAHPFVDGESGVTPPRCDRCGLTASAARHQVVPAPADPLADLPPDEAAAIRANVCRECGKPNTEDGRCLTKGCYFYMGDDDPDEVKGARLTTEQAAILADLEAGFASADMHGPKDPPASAEEYRDHGPGGDSIPAF